MWIGAKQVGLLAGMGLMCVAFEARHAAWSDDVSPPASFDGIVTVDELAQLRAGDFDVTSIVNSTQALEANNSGNSINADQVTSGSVYIDGNAMNDLRGIGQVLANSGPQANVLGAITLNLILNPPPASP
jgi:hypothetical protein